MINHEEIKIKKLHNTIFRLYRFVFALKSTEKKRKDVHSKKVLCKRIICVEIFFDVEYYNNMILLLLSCSDDPKYFNSDPHIAITSHDEQDVVVFGEEVVFFCPRPATPTMLLKTFRFNGNRWKCTLSLGDSR